MSEPNLAIYVPCHYDFSQLEYVAPFLERYHNSKIFVYKWNGLHDKIRDHYLADEYKSYQVGVYDFTLQAIVKCIASEAAQTKVVFLLTASMAYSFGTYQKTLLTKIKDAFPDRVWGISVVGHCMYGCASCTGVDHKVPVYFSRYFRQGLSYNSDSIVKQYFSHDKDGKPLQVTTQKLVLVAPSTGETSLILHRDLLDHLALLQSQKRFYFLFKLHPACFNLKDYDMSYEPSRVEFENLKFIFETFQVTQQEQPCLLPFIEAVDTVLCDLHSTVGFVTSYFSPKRIFAYHNDTGYDVPDRDPEFLDNMYVFDDLEGLKSQFETFPGIKGSNKFFEKTFGRVDGFEVDRFAKLANWPTIDTLKQNSGSAESSISWRAKVSEITDLWESVLVDAVEKSKTRKTDDDNFEQECKMAMGLPAGFVYAKAPKYQPVKVEAKGLKQDVNVMSFNIWNGGESHPANFDIGQVAKVIIKAGADVVGLQEVAGKASPTTGHRSLKTAELCQALNKLSNSSAWIAVDQGIVTPGKGNITPWGMVSRLRLISISEGKFGAQFQLSGSDKSIWVFNTHLPYFPYQPYQLAEIPYEDEPFLTTERQAVESAAKSRSLQVEALIADYNGVKPNGIMVITGDFNEPSPLDWTARAAIAGYHPITCEWPAAKTIAEKTGCVDAYRVMNPDEVAKPGITWNPRMPIADISELKRDARIMEHHDRIDFVFVKHSVECDIADAKVIGSNENQLDSEVADVNMQDWPSDHQAVAVKIRY